MKRLAWKEFRENLWMLVITLLVPVAMLMYVARLVLGGQALGLGGLAGALIMFENVIFAIWGAMRMPPERVTGWLTLRTLPARTWEIWLFKFVSGIGWAVLWSGFVWCLAAIGTGAPAASSPLVIWKVAAGLSLCYTVSFASSLFLSGPASGVIGVLAGTAGWISLLAVFNSAGMNPGGNALAHQVMWAITAALGFLSFAVMAARARGADPRRTGMAFVITCLAVLAIAVGPAIARQVGGHTRSEFLLAAPPNLVPWQGMNRYAYSEVAFPRPAGRDGKESKPTGMRLCVRGTDGELYSQIETASRLTPLAWTSDGQVIYLSRAFGSERMWLKTWNPESGDTHPLAAMSALSNEALDYAPGGPIAVEPNGNRIAFVRVASGRLGFGRYRDLYMKDLRTGEEHMVQPNIGDSRVLWRAGRVYLRSDDLRVVDPNSGRIERARSLPQDTEEEAG